MLRRRRRTADSPSGELNVIPLIDVVFFLLVFYVIASSFTKTTAVPVDRPASSRAAGVGGSVIMVSVLQSGSVELDGKTFPLVSLPPAIRSRLSDAHSTQVIVVADRALPTGHLLAVMDACRNGGAQRVEVAAERKSP
jgi:biopolymer transport protein ExbD